MTFSIVAFDPANGDLGVAVQSKFPNVGVSIPFAKAGIGAVATQSYCNTSYGPRGLALLENGETSIREVVHHHGGACIVPYFEDGTLCMVRQFRYAMQQELWELPAGKLEKGEDPFEAAKRELGEECGLTADHYTPLGEFYPTVGYDTEIIYMWVATGLHTTQMHLDDDEFLTPDRIPLAKAYEMVMSGEIKDGKTIAGVLKLKALVDEGRL